MLALPISLGRAILKKSELFLELLVIKTVVVFHPLPTPVSTFGLGQSAKNSVWGPGAPIRTTVLTTHLLG